MKTRRIIIRPILGRVLMGIPIVMDFDPDTLVDSRALGMVLNNEDPGPTYQVNFSSSDQKLPQRVHNISYLTDGY
jgi:hypothetical protein